MLAVALADGDGGTIFDPIDLDGSTYVRTGIRQECRPVEVHCPLADERCEIGKRRVSHRGRRLFAYVEVRRRVT